MLTENEMDNLEIEEAKEKFNNLMNLNRAETYNIYSEYLEDFYPYLVEHKQMITLESLLAKST